VHRVEAVRADVLEAISPEERMPAEDVPGYMAVGASALRAIRIAQETRSLPDFQSILDFPSGHGRVLRWLKAAYPLARLTACDLLTDGVDWCVDRLGAAGVYSSADPERLSFPEKYDLIWVGSLLTHVDVPMWDKLVRVWHGLLVPNGMLVITTHGDFAAARMSAGHLYGYPEAQIGRLLRAYEHAGFGFLEESPANVDYGISLSRPEWVLQRVRRHADFHVVLAAEMLWDNHQDVFAFVRTELDVAAP
jgi:SAM-dependent methyltransferase